VPEPREAVKRGREVPVLPLRSRFLWAIFACPARFWQSLRCRLHCGEDWAFERDCWLVGGCQM